MSRRKLKDQFVKGFECPSFEPPNKFLSASTKVTIRVENTATPHLAFQ